jgi:hypothetical protein
MNSADSSYSGNQWPPTKVNVSENGQPAPPKRTLQTRWVTSALYFTRNGHSINPWHSLGFFNNAPSPEFTQLRQFVNFLANVATLGSSVRELRLDFPEYTRIHHTIQNYTYDTHQYTIQQQACNEAGKLLSRSSQFTDDGATGRPCPMTSYRHTDLKSPLSTNDATPIHWNVPRVWPWQPLNLCTERRLAIALSAPRHTVADVHRLETTLGLVTVMWDVSGCALRICNNC